jgi:hypothetical protein
VGLKVLEYKVLEHKVLGLKTCSRQKRSVLPGVIGLKWRSTFAEAIVWGEQSARCQRV